MTTEFIEEEVTRLMAINGEDSTASVMLLRSLNKALLAGIEPSDIFEMLFLLERVKRQNYSNM